MASFLRFFLFFGALCTLALPAFTQELGDIVRQENERDSQAHSSPHFKGVSNLVAYVHPQSMAQVLEVKELSSGLALKVQFLNPAKALLISPQAMSYQGDVWVFNSHKRPLYRVIVQKNEISKGPEEDLLRRIIPAPQNDPRRKIPDNILKDHNEEMRSQDLAFDFSSSFKLLQSRDQKDSALKTAFLEKRGNLDLDLDFNFYFSYKLHPSSQPGIKHLPLGTFHKTKQEIALPLPPLPPALEENSENAAQTLTLHTKLPSYDYQLSQERLTREGPDLIELSHEELSHAEFLEGDEAKLLPFNASSDEALASPSTSDSSYTQSQNFDTLDVTQMNLDELKEAMEKITQEIFYYADLDPEVFYEESVLRYRSKGPNYLRQSRDKLFQAMYRLNFQRREMAIAVFTAWGESRSGMKYKYDAYDTKGRAEMIAVINTLYARVIDKQFSIPRPDEILDVALQPSQFSMYSLRDPNWPKAFLGMRYLKEADLPSFEAALLAFKNFKQGVRIYGLENVTHYCRPHAMATWRRSTKQVAPPEILLEDAYGYTESKTATKHVFYINIPWEYFHNQWRPITAKRRLH